MQPQGAAGTITAHRTLQRADLHWGEGLGLASRPSRPLIGWRLLWEKEATLAVHAGGTSQRAVSSYQHPQARAPTSGPRLSTPPCSSQCGLRTPVSHTFPAGAQESSAVTWVISRYPKV